MRLWRAALIRASRSLLCFLALASVGLNACSFSALPSGGRYILAGPASPTRTPFQPLDPGETPESVPELPQTASPALPLETAQPTQPPVMPAASPLPSPAVQGIWAAPSLPAALRNALSLPAGYAFVENREAAALRLEPGGTQPWLHWVYAVVTPFPELPYGLAFSDLQKAWRGEPSGPFAGQPLLLDESTLGVFSALWGAPAPGAVQTLAPGDLLAYAWDHRPAWALVPFEALEPRWKVLEVDGVSPLRKEFDLASYPLSAPFSLTSNQGQPASLPGFSPATNRDASRLTVLVMTGVTALVRATAFAMERQGVLYPGGDVRDWLRNADLTHISNEVPFAENCPFPNPVQASMRFCSDPRYIALLEDVGTDIVELTGDHFADWGTAAMNFTLDLYHQRGWLIYGGGANDEEARQAVTVEHNGNRLAFIGCNAKGGSFAQAGPDQPGAVRCDFDWMHAEITRLRSQGFLPIVTFQHFEYYTYAAQPNQIRDSRGMTEAGAVIVSGSQAHQPQAFEFDGDALIHYGLGNMFFDQYDVSQACRQAFIDRHVFYNGRYISTELLPMMFIDYARPRPMTGEERNDLLQQVFRASGW